MTRPAGPIPADAADVTGRYLGLVDARLPGVVESLFLVGSVALDDYIPGRSDVDFVAVTVEHLGANQLATLASVHADLERCRPDPAFDGIYVTREGLSRDPSTLEDVPFHLDGTFQGTGGFEANPVIWLTLARHPVVIRGSIPRVWTDRSAVREWSIGNLQGYWSETVSMLERVDLEALDQPRLDWLVEWCVSGVLRLAFTLANDDVTSKAGACRFGLVALPTRFHPIVREALALRRSRTPPARDPAARLGETRALMRQVIATASGPIKPRGRPPGSTSAPRA